MSNSCITNDKYVTHLEVTETLKIPVIEHIDDNRGREGEIKFNNKTKTLMIRTISGWKHFSCIEKKDEICECTTSNTPTISELNEIYKNATAPPPYFSLEDIENKDKTENIIYIDNKELNFNIVDIDEEQFFIQIEKLIQDANSLKLKKIKIKSDNNQNIISWLEIAKIKFNISNEGIIELVIK